MSAAPAVTSKTKTAAKAPAKPPTPFDVDDNACIMLSVHWNGAQTRMLLPYIGLTEALRDGSQAVLVFSNDVEVRLLFKAGPREWSADSLFDAIQEHRIRRIYDDPQNGLGVDVVRLIRTEDGVEEEPVMMKPRDTAEESPGEE